MVGTKNVPKPMFCFGNNKLHTGTYSIDQMYMIPKPEQSTKKAKTIESKALFYYSQVPYPKNRPIVSKVDDYICCVHKKTSEF